jgi:hypothetical protein
VGGRERVLSIDGPDSSIAELPVFDGGSYRASVVAIDEATLLFVRKQDLQMLCLTHPQVALKVLGVVGARLRRLVGIIEELSFTTVRHRLASFQLRLAQKEGKSTVAAGSGDNVGTRTRLAQINMQLKTGAANLGCSSPTGIHRFQHFRWGVPTRMLTLNEDFDEFGRLIQTMGTFNQSGSNNQGLPTWGCPYLDPITENPKAGATEVWQVMNLTGETYPIHFHLVNVQLIQRQAFVGDPSNWTYAGDPLPPDANEIGWKETVRMNPGEVTTIIMQFDLPNLATAAMRNAVSPRTGGKEYVWHCHILEHEEHDMTRSLVVE